MNVDNINRENGENEEEQMEAGFENLFEDSFDYSPLERGEIRRAVILQIRPNEILVDLGAKRDGVVPSQDLDRLDQEMREGLRVGQEIPVYVLNPRDHDGNLVVSINLGLQQYDWERATELLSSQDITEVMVQSYNKGGILVRWGRLEGFVPSSHLMTMSAQMTGPNRREAFPELQGRTLGVKVIEVDQKRRRLIFSEREAQREWRAQQKARLMAELEIGDKVHGTVTGIRDFGAFVDLGGADGLIHVSELAWHRVEHPSDVLKVGEEIEVYVLSLDYDRNRIALSRKRLLPDPWEDAEERYQDGQMVEGLVTNVVDFGAFIVLEDGLEGLLHLSEMGEGDLQEPHSYIKKGDKLQLYISRLEPDKRRVGFTQREVILENIEAGAADASASAEVEAPIDEAEATEEAAEETPPVEEPPSEASLVTEEEEEDIGAADGAAEVPIGETEETVEEPPTEESSRVDDEQGLDETTKAL